MLQVWHGVPVRLSFTDCHGTAPNRGATASAVSRNRRDRPWHATERLLSYGVERMANVVGIREITEEAAVASVVGPPIATLNAAELAKL
jgi:hypothetical protein